MPAFALLLLGPVAVDAGAPRSCWPCSRSPTSGIAVVGTLVGALAVQTRARDLIVPLLALPLLVPVVIGAARGRPRRCSRTAGAGHSVRCAGCCPRRSMIWCSGCSPSRVFDFLLED